MTYRSVVVIGGSGAGKTTAVKGIRDAEGLIVPKRFVAPALRCNDDPEETTQLDESTFHRMVAEHKIVPTWRRQLIDGGFQHYGFRAGLPEDPPFRVYSANNDFPRHHTDPIIGGILSSALIVLVTCDGDERRHRLAQRSHDLPEVEREHRLFDTGLEIIDMAADMGWRLEELDTTDMQVEECQIVFGALVNRVLTGDI